MAAGVPWDNNTFIPSEFVAHVATAEDLKTTSVTYMPAPTHALHCHSCTALLLHPFMQSSAHHESCETVVLAANMTVMQPSAMEEEYQDIMGQSLRNLLDTAAKDVANAVGDASSSNVAAVHNSLLESLLKDPDAFKAAMAPVVTQLKELEIATRSAAKSKRGRKAAAPSRAAKATPRGQPKETAPKLLPAPITPAKSEAWPNTPAAVVPDQPQSCLTRSEAGPNTPAASVPDQSRGLA
ncbi:hypothetical protein HaLaN_28090 [Haematococcus lacustris]|uniref:Uncharacterized protein n=1 Tax=Haematococcus lacustris TaxID=44745 RepID=A0A6A0AC15_HAELA|nr:hypothetical protein HaLaN_28090 [Haematococcus lacustris]